MLSPSVVVTGGADGVIRRWDLSGEGKKREEEIKQRVADTPQAAAAVAAAEVPAVAEAAAPAARMRFLDYYFSEAIDARAAAAGSTSIVPVVGQSRASVPTAAASSATKAAAAPAKEAAPAGKASRVADLLAQLTEAVDTYARGPGAHRSLQRPSHSLPFPFLTTPLPGTRTRSAPLPSSPCRCVPLSNTSVEDGCSA